jgi:hypothetical protein
MNLQENIRRILMEENKNKKLPSFFNRRIDHYKFETMMIKGIPYIFYDTNTLEEFKYKLIELTLQNYIYYKYNIEISEELPKEDIDLYVKHSHHIVTFEDISPDCLKLIHKGTGKSW